MLFFGSLPSAAETAAAEDSFVVDSDAVTCGLEKRDREARVLEDIVVTGMIGLAAAVAGASVGVVGGAVRESARAAPGRLGLVRPLL